MCAKIKSTTSFKLNAVMYISYDRYSYAHSLKLIRLSTLFTVGAAIHVHVRNKYLHFV